MSEATDRQRVRFGFIALGFALFSVVWFMAAALGSNFGLWSWQFGLGTMIGNVNAGIGRFIILISLILAVVVLIMGLIKSPRTRTVMLGIAALLISLFIAGRWMGFQLTALGLPPIHQASTDWVDPVQFSDNLMTARELDHCDENGDGSLDVAEKGRCSINAVEDDPIVELSAGAQENWPGFNGRKLSEVQESAEMDPAERGEDRDEKPYPPLNTLATDMSQTEVFDLALALVEARGWHVAGANHEAGRIEGWASTPWFGFTDDFALRILANEDGQTEVDMRSVSRVGLSDLGANSQRVYGFMSELEREIEAAG